MVVLSRLGGILEPSRAILGRLRAVLKPSCAILQPSYAHVDYLEASLGHLISHLGPRVRPDAHRDLRFWHAWGHLGSSRAVLWSFWALFEASWTHLL
jgi:hypothetical protein